MAAFDVGPLMPGVRAVQAVALRVLRVDRDRPTSTRARTARRSSRTPARSPWWRRRRTIAGARRSRRACRAPCSCLPADLRGGGAGGRPAAFSSATVCGAERHCARRAGRALENDRDRLAHRSADRGDFRHILRCGRPGLSKRGRVVAVRTRKREQRRFAQVVAAEVLVEVREHERIFDVGHHRAGTLAEVAGREQRIADEGRLANCPVSPG